MPLMHEWPGEPTENHISFYKKISTLAKALWGANGGAKGCPIAKNILLTKTGISFLTFTPGIHFAYLRDMCQTTSNAKPKRKNS